MTELEYSIDIARPVADVFEIVADPRNDACWCPRVRDCEQVAGDGVRVGARFAVEHRPSLHRPHPRHIEIVELERPRRVVSIQEDQVGRFTIAYELEPSRGGTRLTQRDRIVWRRALGGSIGRRIVRRHMASQLRTLKRLLEG